jgi:hypothetical protein
VLKGKHMTTDNTEMVSNEESQRLTTEAERVYNLQLEQAKKAAAQAAAIAKQASETKK